MDTTSAHRITRIVGAAAAAAWALPIAFIHLPTADARSKSWSEFWR